MGGSALERRQSCQPGQVEEGNERRERRRGVCHAQLDQDLGLHRSAAWKRDRANSSAHGNDQGEASPLVCQLYRPSVSLRCCQGRGVSREHLEEHRIVAQERRERAEQVLSCMAVHRRTLPFLGVDRYRRRACCCQGSGSRQAAWHPCAMGEAWIQAPYLRADRRSGRGDDGVPDRRLEGGVPGRRAQKPCCLKHANTARFFQDQLAKFSACPVFLLC
mmetsp:Transcript_7397/g.16864  ORF Transcript_7397/g.16864 Transcript_7397/m.16864 type:complete len:218 (-) Transcript_7397:59-712(-)